MISRYSSDRGAVALFSSRRCNRWSSMRTYNTTNPFGVTHSPGEKQHQVFLIGGDPFGVAGTVGGGVFTTGCIGGYFWESPPGFVLLSGNVSYRIQFVFILNGNCLLSCRIIVMG